jgi:serine/threonine protein kinase
MPVGEDADLDLQGTEAGATVQLGADYLSYVRKRLAAAEFKDQLIERLLPTVPLRGEPFPVQPRQRFGKFYIEGRLGKGGMAEVFLARDPERGGSGSGEHVTGPDREGYVALKVMKPDIALDGSYVRRFLRESANAALVEHRNVVTVYEVGSVKGRLYFTMEQIEGETLKDHLARGALDEEEGVQVLCQLVDGLMAAHERGIGHRDLKPANIMLITSEARYGLAIQGEFDVVVKITDFGLARQLTTDTSDVMPEGRFLGTAKYVAPEVVRGGEATLKSDVFSLGILAFQLFAGRPPFRAKNKLEYIAANLQQQAPPLDTLAPVSKALASLVDSMLDKNPERRPDAAALRRDLGRLRSRSESGAVQPVDDPTSVFHGEGLDTGSGAALHPQPLHLAAAAGACLLLVIGLFLALRGDPNEGPPELPPTVPVSELPGDGTKTSLPDPGPDPDPVPPPDADGLLAEVPVPAASAFSTGLARRQVLDSLREGDAAWRRDDPVAALAAWETAGQLLGRLPDPLPAPLERRLRAARGLAALVRADEAEARGDLRQALDDVEIALANGQDSAELLERRDRLREWVEREGSFDQRLVAARALTRDAATRDEGIAELRALLPLARRLDREESVLAALRRLGVDGEQGGGQDTDPDAPPDPPRTRGDELLDQAQDMLQHGMLTAAAQALDAARDAGADPTRAGPLRERLDRARQAPPGTRYLEVEAAAFFASPQQVTNQELAAWRADDGYHHAAPTNWGGRDQPPSGTERDPVQGVTVEAAMAYAAAQRQRLPTAPERARIREAFELGPAPLGEPDGEHYPQGFWTVEDYPGGSR